MPDTNIYTSKLNTGKITFNNGIKIIGALEGSSDGEGCDTIELVPDINQYDLGQYLVIEPNLDEDRIHIRAGGTPDDSAAKLVLGGLQTHVALNDQDTDRIIIRTKNTAEDGNHAWSFTSDGTTQFPLLNVDLHNGGVQEAETLQFSGEGTQCVITGPTPVLDVNAQRLIIQGQSATGTGEGGDVYIWAGDAQTNAGDIKIYAGDADASGSGNGGYVYIDGGAGVTSGGPIILTGGTSGPGAGGNVELRGGSGITSGEIVLTSNSNTWTFNNDGNTTIPDLKDIRDVSGNTAIGGGNRVKNYNSSSGSVVPIDENNIYAINTTTQATTVKLPASATTPIGYEFTVIDTIGNAASKNITITAESGDLIVSAPSGIAIDTDYGLLAFKYIGNKNWVILYGR